MAEKANVDLLLRGGHVIDPANHRNGVMDVAIRDGRVAKVAPELDPTQAIRVVELEGLYVVPGLIDIHVHVHHTREPEGLSVIADHHSFRSGVTTVVDTGTAGAKHFLHFKRTVIDLAKTRILAYVNIVKSGMLGDFEQDPDEMDPELAAATVLAYPELCVGIKTAHYWTREPWDDVHQPWIAVDRAIEAAELCQKHVMFDFWPRPERPYRELLLEKMRPGDIHTHVYAQQFPILDEESRPQAFLFEAREKGIIFDVGHGAGSFWFRKAVPAIEGGFGPDSISTDLHIGNVNGPVIDMQTTMSKCLNIGLSLEDVIYRSTVTPAREIGRSELGTLSEGAEADVTVLQLERGRFGFTDCGAAKLVGDKRLRCLMTLRAGEIVFDSDGLSMPTWTEAPPSYWELRR
ncbi:MAG: amidohydrolase/deacetylase family metallohydrolase [Trueperaceae bacterium]|nr:MAG: amidohydrolase/deacetylase family metallohydrolase [Trueperaceae bacterium]